MFEWLIGLMLFGISYIYIAMKATQQIAVVNNHRKWVVPVSLCLAFCEVTTVTVLAIHKNIWYFPFIGLGAGLGALTTMYFYNRIKKEKQ
jgi:hypothetical protein